VRCFARGGDRDSPYDPRMSKLLLNLRHVPEDEADDVRAFLDANGIAYYETAPSRWGISHGGIWLTHDKDFAEAKRLMAEYQARRSVQAREAWAAARRDGSAESFIDVIRREPLRVLLIVVAILFLLGLVALPVFLLAR
jgi:hypothetical protein